MKKAICTALAVLLSVLFIPIPKGTFDDGGTREYAALTYKIVVWNKINITIDENGKIIDDRYHKTSVFWYPDNQKSIDELWQIEMNE